MPTTAVLDLKRTKSYCVERQKDIRAELGRLKDEAPPLKAELETSLEKQRVAEIRSRLSYLKTRSGELKAERESVAEKLEAVRTKLKALQAANSDM